MTLRSGPDPVLDPSSRGGYQEGIHPEVCVHPRPFPTPPSPPHSLSSAQNPHSGSISDAISRFHTVPHRSTLFFAEWRRVLPRMPPHPLPSHPCTQYPQRRHIALYDAPKPHLWAHLCTCTPLRRLRMFQDIPQSDSLQISVCQRWQAGPTSQPWCTVEAPC